MCDVTQGAGGISLASSGLALRPEDPPHPGPPQSRALPESQLPEPMRASDNYTEAAPPFFESGAASLRSIAPRCLRLSLLPLPLYLASLLSLALSLSRLFFYSKVCVCVCV